MESRSSQRNVALATVVALVAVLVVVLARQPTAAAATTTFVPVADTYVAQDLPTTNYGAAADLVVKSAPARKSFLKYTVAGLSKPVTAAKLRLHVRDLANAGSPVGGSLSRMTDTSWSETGVTWNAQPAVPGPVLGTLPAVNRNTWYEFNVTSVIAGNGTYSFGMTTTHADGAYYDTRESGANAPQLVVTTTDDPPPTGGTVTVNPAADTYVAEDLPTTNYGAAADLVVKSAPARRSFLKFTVAGVGQPVTAAKLRLHVRDLANAGSPVGGTVSKMTDTGWSETAVTWNTRPAIPGPALGTLPAVNRNTWYEVDVTSAITGNGTFSFGMTTTHADGAYYDTRESGANGPKLVVTYGTAPPADQVLVGAGDIASCDSAGDEATANLLDGIPGTVFTSGDNAYPNATPADYTNCYGPSWGRHKARTKPTAGNHEYIQSGAPGYYGYFGAGAGDPAKGYYSYDLGNWHVVVLNTNCALVGGCEAGSPQETWLRQDLQSSSKSCTAAFGHHPLFTSGPHTNATETRPLYQALYDNNAEVIVAGHNHQYERFAPQNPNGGLDNARGIREFVAGMGGASHYQFAVPQPNSEVRNADTYGVLKLTLKAGSYDWQVVPEAGKTFTDSGTGNCH